jgi:hypothetical protein
MGKLAIVEPMAIVSAIGPGTVPGNLLTPNPREVWQSPAATGLYYVEFDMGQEVTVDSVFAGNVSPQITFAALYTQTGPGGLGRVRVGDLTLGDASAPVRHGFTVPDSPLTSRYFSIRFSTTGGAGTAGVVAFGKAFTPFWGHEWGAGRSVEDTSVVERLKGGGFGIDEGTIAGGYSWTLGDLSDEELQQLYGIVRRLGIARSVLVVEDVEQTIGLNERLHWGLFNRLETYERLSPGLSRWAFKIWDW